MKAMAIDTDREPALTRLSALAALTGEDRQLLDAAMNGARGFVVRSELLREGDPIAQPMLMLSGWAAQVRQLSDGRRQVLSLILPGELIGICRVEHPIVAASVVALTDVTLARMPARCDLPEHSDLTSAYDLSRALDEQYLLAQVTRLGRLNAYERIADLLLELDGRLALSGLASSGQFAMPLTQELLADLLGLTSVHVNRTLQTMRREEVLSFRSGNVVLRDRVAMARLVDYRPSRLLG